ncbi:MAG TPA: hypothetical protein VI895_14515 [Bdellovibrionota bacterium]|nr:hypothetical protein [Bdellovibrionota bacterium]
MSCPVENDRAQWILVATGIGAAAAREGALEAIRRYAPLKCAVGFGFAGGLVKTARAGDTVIPTELRHSDRREEPTEWLRMNLASFAPSVEWRKLVTVERVVSTPAEKAALHAATGAEAVDMESAIWGELCRSAGVPWAVVRTILDSGDESLPCELSRLVDAFGRTRWSTALPTLTMHPSLVWSVFKFSRRSSVRAAPSFVQTVTGWLAAEDEKEREQRGEPAIVSARSQFSRPYPAQ